jgi:predicted N-acetyltransferase YhbS
MMQEYQKAVILPDDQAGITIRRLTEADVDAAGVIAGAAFGSPESHSREIRRYLALQLDGWLLALADDTPVGMVGAVDYGPFACVGLLAVDPAVQHRGVGGALMRRLLEWLDARGTRVAILDATEAGAAIYLRLGFAEADLTEVYQLAHLALPGALPDGVRVLEQEDVPALTEFDAPIFGADRAAVFGALLAEGPGRAFAVRSDAGELSGYVFAQARRLGPWVARHPRDAEMLLRAALSVSYTAAPTVLAPKVNSAATALLERSGFQTARFTRHMRLGGSHHPIQRELIYGLASFALG